MVVRATPASAAISLARRRAVGEKSTAVTRALRERRINAAYAKALKAHPGLADFP